MGDLLFLVFAFVAFVVGRGIAWDLDSGRIHECIESCGGKVLDIDWNPMGHRWLSSLHRWLGISARTYDVRYETPQGKVCEATCKTKMFAGVSWIVIVPPGLSAGQTRQNAYVSGETITCLECRSTIPAGHSRCTNCGWSYMAG